MAPLLKGLPLSTFAIPSVASNARRAIHVPRINSTRLNESIHATSVWGAAHRWGAHATESGMARLALSDDDALTRRWFIQQTAALGCAITVDQMGNTYAVRRGLRAGPPTAIGSHLDTQPSGGRYDGILGVLAGLEALRTLDQEGIKTEFPVAVINWTNEEGARFPKSIVSSSVWAGAIPLQDAWDLKEVAGTGATLRSELQRIGFLGDTPCSHEAIPLAGHFELHIEQGPRLEASSCKVGVVVGAQAYRWYTVTVYGRECHTGSTPFSVRSDAMLCAARVIVASNAVAKAHGGLASTGLINAFPGSTNTVPGKVILTIDMRHPQDLELYAMEAELRKVVSCIATESERGCTVEWRLDSDSKAINFDEDCIRCVWESAEDVVGRDMAVEMTSGAGHDSCVISTRCPTSMIFVPSKDGVSHNPVEYTSPEDCAIGAQVLLGAVLRFDQHRAQRG